MPKLKTAASAAIEPPSTTGNPGEPNTPEPFSAVVVTVVKPPERKWEERDKEFVKTLVQRVFDLQEQAIGAGDIPTLRQASDFLVNVAQLRDLYDAFRNSPKRRIHGRGGVAEQLSLTRNGVYCRLDAFGLNPADFASDRSTFRKLIKRVKLLRGMLERLGFATR